MVKRTVDMAESPLGVPFWNVSSVSSRHGMILPFRSAAALGQSRPAPSKSATASMRAATIFASATCVCVRAIETAAGRCRYPALSPGSKMTGLRQHRAGQHLECHDIDPRHHVRAPHSHHPAMMNVARTHVPPRVEHAPIAQQCFASPVDAHRAAYPVQRRQRFLHSNQRLRHASATPLQHRRA